MSQNSDDYRNNPRNYPPPPNRDNSNQPNFGPDYTVPSLIFDEYGELIPNEAARQEGPGDGNNSPTIQIRPQPQPGPRPMQQQPLAGPGLQQAGSSPQPQQPGAGQPALPETQFDSNPMPSLLFDEYGELKSAVFKSLKPSNPQGPTQGPVREPDQGRGFGPNGQGAGQGQYQPQSFYPGPQGPVPGQRQYPAPAGQPQIYAQGQGQYYQQGGPAPLVRQNQGRLSKWVWFGLGAVAAVLILAIVLLLVVILTKQAPPPASTTQVPFDSILKILTPGPSDSPTPGMVVKSFRKFTYSL